MIKKFYKLKKYFIVLLFFLVVFCLILTVMFASSRKNTVYADTSSFGMRSGMEVRAGYDGEDTLGRILVDITQEMYNKLTLNGGTFSFGNAVFLKGSPYYLRLNCASSLDLFMNTEATGDVFVAYYNVNGEASALQAKDLGFNEEHNIAYLTFELPQPFSSEFYYYVDFIHATQQDYIFTPSVTSPEYGMYEYVYQSGSSIWTVERTKGVKKILFADELIGTQSRTPNYVLRSAKYVAELTLEYASEMLEDEQISYLQNIAGISIPGETFTVNVHYKKCYGFNDVREKIEQFSIDKLYCASSAMTFSSIRNLMGFADISYFNCVYKNVISFVDGTVYETDSRIVRQAVGYSYVFNSSTNTGDLYITYTDFYYKDFCIKLMDNDTDDAINLSMYVYCTDVLVEDGIYTLFFDYSTIVHQSFTSLGWIFELEEDNFYITNNSTTVLTSFTENGLEVSFPYTDEVELEKVAILVSAEIIPDYETTINVNYKELTVVNGNIVANGKLFTENIMYSALIPLYNATSFRNRYKNIIDNALIINSNPSLKVYEYENLSVSKVDTKNYRIDVEYKYFTILKIINSLNSEVSFFNLFKNSLLYNFSEFNYTVPINYRVSNLVEVSNGYTTITFNEIHPEESVLKIITNVNQDLIITLKAILTDRWPVEINYLKQYKESCFAVKEVFRGEISFKDYPDLTEITGEDIESIIGEDNVRHIVFKDIPIRIVDDSITFIKNGSLFEFNFDYSYTYIKAIDSDGNADYYNIPLTPFSKWCENFGTEWSIVALAPNVFTYSDEVSKDELYGFFTVMTFQEQVSDFNSWFNTYTSGGCCTFFAQKQITGSKFYQFMANNQSLLTVAGATSGILFGHPVVGTLVGSVATFTIMSVSESLNEDNGIYYSYFLYLDGSTTEPYSSHNGATDYGDEDSAFGNSVGKVKDGIIGWFNDSSVGKIIKAFLFVFLTIISLGLILLALGFCFKGIGKIVNTTKSIKTNKNKGGKHEK